MAFRLGERLGSINLNAVAQGMGGLVFGTGDKYSQEDGGVQRLLDRIQHGMLADDRRAAISDLQLVVAEDRAAKTAFGSIGFPVIISIFRDERDDIDMLRGALETLLAAVTPDEAPREEAGQIMPYIVNSELFAREPNAVALVLSLLDEIDFYVRYYALQTLTALLTYSPGRLQEVILLTPNGITRLMDMLQEREVIRNEALLLLIYLTREAEEIQKIVVFEGAFEKLFAIIAEEGGPEGGIIVQDCFELMNNLLRQNSSNQVFLRETCGLHQVAGLLKLRKGGADGFSEQKSVNILCALETVTLLLTSVTKSAASKDANVVANQTLLCQHGCYCAQNKLMDALLSLCVEGRVTNLAIRCSALRCIGDLVIGHLKNREVLGSTIVGEEPDCEPALNAILRVLLRATKVNECIAADYVLRCYCEGNPDGQAMLASTITPLPRANARGMQPSEGEKGISFGSMLVQALISSDGRNDLEASCRAANVLSHILKDNKESKERILQIPLEIPSSALAPAELLMPRCIRYLAAAAPPPSSADEGTIWLQPVLLRLLVTWLADCPPAVGALLEPASHLPFLVELLSNSGSPASTHVAGLAAVLLGECIIYNPTKKGLKDGPMIVDVITGRFGLTMFFSKWEDMQKSSLFVSAETASRLPKPLTRSTAAAAVAGDGLLAVAPGSRDESQAAPDAKEPALTTFYDAEFVAFIRRLEPMVRDRIVEVFARPKSRASVESVGFEAEEGESERDYIARLRLLLQSQARELQDISEKNASLAEDLLGRDQKGDQALSKDGLQPMLDRPSVSSTAKAETESLKEQLRDAYKKVDASQLENQALAAEASQCKQLVEKIEGDLQGLSEAYNNLEVNNYKLETEAHDLRKLLEGKGIPSALPSEEHEEGRQDAKKASEKESEKETEGEMMDDLLECLGQEEKKVEVLKARLVELGVDVDELLQGIGEHDEDEDEDAEVEEE